jgi:hypothetical protein
LISAGLSSISALFCAAVRDSRVTICVEKEQSLIGPSKRISYVVKIVACGRYLNGGAIRDRRGYLV